MKLKAPTPLGKSKTEQDDKPFKSPIKTKEGDSKTLKIQFLNFIKAITTLFERLLSKQKHLTEEKEEKVGIKDKTARKKIDILQKKPLLYTLAIGIPLLFLFVLAIIIITYIKAEPFNLANSFLEKVKQKNISAAYELTTVTYQIVVPKTEFRNVVDRLNSINISDAKVKKKRRETVKGMGTYAFMTLEVPGYYIELVMYNAQKDWGVHSITINTK